MFVKINFTNKTSVIRLRVGRNNDIGEIMDKSATTVANN